MINTDIDTVVQVCLYLANKSDSELLSIKSSLSYKEVITALVITNSVKEAADYLKVKFTSFEHKVNRNIKPLFSEKPYKVKWNNYLLSQCDLKRCSTCHLILNSNRFVKNTANWDNLKHYCIECQAQYKSSFTKNNPTYSAKHYLENKSDYIARAIKYKTQRNIATVPWADKAKIKEIYSNCPEGCHVDHIIPLQGTSICGLHVESNLQYLSIKDNLVKSNKFSG